MKNISLVFSLSFAALTAFALVGTGSYLSHILPEPPPVKNEVRISPPPAPVEEPVTPPTIEVNEVVLTAPRPSPKAPVRAKLAAQAPEKQFVCENQWHDSQLFVGGQYKNCQYK